MSQRSSGEILTLGQHQVRVLGHLELDRTDHGARPLRLPRGFWSQFPPVATDMLRATVSEAGGVRLAFQTKASTVSLHVRCTSVRLGGTVVHPNTFVLTVNGADAATHPSSTDVEQMMALDGRQVDEVEHSEYSTVTFGDLGPGNKSIEIWLPQMSIVDLVGLDADAAVTATVQPEGPVWVHHGSSISHCGEAENPTDAWPVVAARAAGLNLINLGFAGQCALDPFIASAIADTPADIITLKLGTNLVVGRSMDTRVFTPAVHGFLDRIRLGHPQTPILIVSPLFWPDYDELPGPTRIDVPPDGSLSFAVLGTPADIAQGALSMALARDHLAKVVGVRRRSEPIEYLDGRDLYGPEDVLAWPLPDGLHPGTALYREIGRRFASRVFGRAGFFPATRSRVA